MDLTLNAFKGMNDAFAGMFNDPDIPTDPEGVVERNAADQEHDLSFLQAMGLEDFVKIKVEQNLLF